MPQIIPDGTSLRSETKVLIALGLAASVASWKLLRDYFKSEPEPQLTVKAGLSSIFLLTLLGASVILIRNSDMSCYSIKSGAKSGLVLSGGTVFVCEVGRGAYNTILGWRSPPPPPKPPSNQSDLNP